ncbi:MAG: class I SAM-dependent methyltransferase [Phycisphaerales bacterium]|nr:MAG: class I SAM-dependent methyltransferase [Phycisphaerales bacterium]
MGGQKAVSITVLTEDPAIRAVAQALADRLGLPPAPAPGGVGSSPKRGAEEAVGETAGGVGLVFTDEGLELRDWADRSIRGVRVDFTRRDFRPGSRSMSRRQPLVRAVGAKTETVLDATAGLGRDAALLACLGYCVTAVERSPIIAALLEDGLRRARDQPRTARALGDRLTLACADARDVLESLEVGPDAVYVDPMFPPKRRASALPKKDVRLLRAVVGDDPDAADLVAVALQHPCRRVIVKRPDYAAPLGPQPSLTFAGKLVRYDVYLK